MQRSLPVHPPADRTLRRSLLESIDTYAQHLTTAVLEEQIFPHLQTGFTDGNAYIRELTLKSVLSLAPKLSNKTLVNNVLKHLSKLQARGLPSAPCAPDCFGHFPHSPGGHADA